MISTRKTRTLAISAALLTIVFIVISTHSSNSIMSFNNNTPAFQHKGETTTKIDSIDESAIKKNEEKLKQQTQDAKNTDKSNQEIKKEQVKGSANGKDALDVFDAASEFQSIMNLSPVVIFSKTYCGFSASLKNLLKAEYEINPPPTIVELDKHKNGRELQEYIAIKSGRKTVPNVFVNGVSRGGCDEMKKLHTDGKLSTSLNSWGNRNIKVTKVSAPSNS